MSTGQNENSRAGKDPFILRMRFGREDPAIWLSHLDLMRTFERSVRRAGLPAAYSQGFNPRPQMTFALPLGVGLATTDDYLDLSLTGEVDPEAALAALNQSLPAGLRVLRAVPVAAGGKSLMSLISAAEYEIAAPGLAAAFRLLAEIPDDDPWQITRETKKGIRTIDIRPLLLKGEILDEMKIRVLVRAGSRDNLRPDLLLSFLSQNCCLEYLAAQDAAITRTRLLIETDGRLTGLLP